MKKDLLYLFATAVLLLAASCSSDDLLSSADGDGDATVTFNVNALGSASTRTYSDGTTATVLHYGVYDSSTGYLSAISSEEVGTETMSDLQATVTLNLAKGNSYTIVFWAEAEESPYEVSFADTETDDSGNETSVSPTVTFKEGYDIVNNDENRDAFYAVVETGVVSSSYDETVTLTRPFAQLNVGTLSTDLAAYEATGNLVAYTKVVVTGVGNTLNLLTGDVTYDDSTSGKVTFEWAEIPDADDESFPLNSSSSDDDDSSSDSTDDTSSSDSSTEVAILSYDYLAMNYLLVGEDACTVDVQFYYSASEEEESGHVVEVSSVPVQRNYKTNLYGSLLTGEFTYYVTINSDYENNQQVVNVSTSTALLAALGDKDVDVVVLDDDLTVDNNTTYIDHDVTLDLGGQTLTLSNESSKYTSRIQVASDASATITNGTIVADDYYGILAEEGSSVTLEGVTLEGDATVGVCSFADDVTITATDVDVEAIYGYYTTGDDAEITISGGEITTYCNGISMKGSDSELTVEEATINLTGSAAWGVVVGRYDTSNSTTTSGNTATLTDTTIDGGDATNTVGVVVVGYDNEVTVDGCTIESSYYGITQNGSYTPGSTITVKDTEISTLNTGIYLSMSTDSKYYNTLTVTDCKITSEKQSPIEVKKCYLTVSGSTLTSQFDGKGGVYGNNDSQEYVLYGSGSGGSGFGIVLAGYTLGKEYGDDFTETDYISLTDVTYKLGKIYAMDGKSDPWYVVYYADDDSSDGGIKTYYISSGSVTDTNDIYSREYSKNGATSSSSFNNDFTSNSSSSSSKSSILQRASSSLGAKAERGAELVKLKRAMKKTL